MQTEPLSDYERERGKPMPSKAHGYTQSNLIIALAEFRTRYTIFSELTDPCTVGKTISSV